MFKALVEEVDKEHMDNVNRETETLRKNKKEMLEKQNNTNRKQCLWQSHQ